MKRTANYLAAMLRRPRLGKAAGRFDNGNQRWQAVVPIGCYGCGDLIDVGEYYSRKTVWDQIMKQLPVCVKCLERWRNKG